MERKTQLNIGTVLNRKIVEEANLIPKKTTQCRNSFNRKIVEEANLIPKTHIYNTHTFLA